MAGFEDFINLFAPPGAVEAQREREAQQATARSLQELIAGNQQPFEADLFPGEQQIPGLSTGTPGVLPQGAERDFISELLRSGSQQFAGQGIGLANQALQGIGQRDLAANARQSLQESRQQALSGVRGQLGPAQAALADIFQGGGPSSSEAFKALAGQFDPFTLSQGQARFGGLGNQIAEGPKKIQDLDAKRQKDFSNSTTLRNQFIGVTKEFSAQDKSYGRILASATDPSAAGDLALIFNYMKLLDPGSTVREGEFATAAAAGSFGDRIQGAMNRVQSGQRLTEAQRADFVDRADKLFTQAAKQHKVTADEFTGLAKRQQLDPENVVFRRQTLGQADVSRARNAGIPRVGETQQIGGFKVKRIK